MHETGLNKRLLKSIMVANGDSAKDVADYLNISYASLSLRMNGHTQFGINDITALIKRYGLTPEQVYDIFFAVKVATMDTDKKGD